MDDDQYGVNYRTNGLISLTDTLLKNTADADLAYRSILRDETLTDLRPSSIQFVHKSVMRLMRLDPGCA